VLLLAQQIVHEWYPRKSTGLLTQLQESLGSTSFWFKVVILLFCAPLWYPIVKALLREIDSALRKDGGILARTFTERDLKRLEERYGAYEDPLRSIPRTARDGQRTAGPARGGAARAGDKAPPQSGGRTGRSIRSTRVRRF